MKRGFTLLEILIVVIIIAILATLAFNQYMNTIERARGAEVKQIFGNLRSLCAARYMEDGSTVNCDAANMSIGPGLTDTPSACKPTHFFRYSVTQPSADEVQFTADRCLAGGKAPWNTAQAVSLTVDYAQGGNDTWNNPFGY